VRLGNFCIIRRISEHGIGFDEVLVKTICVIIVNSRKPSCLYTC
jgi:hypothetical protein